MLLAHHRCCKAGHIGAGGPQREISITVQLYTFKDDCSGIIIMLQVCFLQNWTEIFAAFIKAEKPAQKQDYQISL